MKFVTNAKKAALTEVMDKGKIFFLLIHGLLKIGSFLSLVFSFMVFSLVECLPLEVRFIFLFGLSYLILSKYFKKLIDKKMVYIRNLSILLVSLYLLSFLWHKKANADFLDNLYCSYFPVIYRPKVELIEGSSTSWMDYNKSLTFKSDYETVVNIIKDYQKIDKDSLGGNFFNKSVMNNSKVIFYNKVISSSNVDKMYDNYLLAWDKYNKTVFFNVHNGWY